MERIDMARQIADGATDLDWLKNSAQLSAAELAESKRHIDNLHLIAEQLAGARVHEIYSPDEAVTMQAA